MQLQDEIKKAVSVDSKDKIVLLRVAGTLARGKPSDINFKQIFENFSESYFAMKNTSGLSSAEYTESVIDAKVTADEILRAEKRAQLV